MLRGSPAAARAGVVVGDLDPLDRWVGARVDLDAAAVGVEEGRLADVVRLDRRLLAAAGREVVRAGDREAAQHGLARDLVAEIDHVVHDCGVAVRFAIGQLGIAGCERDVANRLQGDTVVT